MTTDNHNILNMLIDFTLQGFLVEGQLQNMSHFP